MFKVQPFAFQPTASNFPNPSLPQHRGSVPSVTIVPADQHINQQSREFSYSALRLACNGFDKSNVLGTGSFGSVHRGMLEDGTNVAVKVIGKPQISGFENEVKILSKYRHPNFVMLLGFGRNGNERLLVYECMARGDCERIIKDKTLSSEFTWQRRLSVLLDACRGLTYMVTSQPIAFHRDIKPSNILVNDDWVGKMADFGLASELPSSEMTSLKVPTSAGTMGYACPVYVQTGTVSEASEIYSFGICILEFLTGQPPTMNNHMFPGQVIHLVEKINGNLSSLVSLADKKVAWPSPVAQSLGQLVIDCCNRPVGQRPTFLEIVKKLNEIYINFVLKSHHSPPAQPIIDIKPASPIMAPLPLSSFNQFQAAMSKDVKIDNIVPTSRPGPVPPSTACPSLELRSISDLRQTRTLYLTELQSDQNIHPDQAVVIGRNRQTELFSELLQSDTLRLCVSRDHFEIRRDISGKFQLVNLSGNGTVVEGRGFLDTKSDSMELRDNDIIKLVRTGINGSQSPFLEMVFKTGATAEQSATLSYSLCVRNMENNINERLELDLVGQSNVVIGRNTGSGVFARVLRNQERFLQLIDLTHFAIVLSRETSSAVVKSLSDKGVIVGSEFVPSGREKLLTNSSQVDISIPGVPHLVITFSTNESPCIANGVATQKVTMQPNQALVGQTMIGIPPILPTSRVQKFGAYAALIR